jgi:hypothetical protein
MTGWPDSSSGATQSLDFRPSGHLANFIIHRTAAHLTADIGKLSRKCIFP